jgi:outer membrane lipoprotein-sorting protein
MKCLTPTQIERLALGLSDETAHFAHLEACAACRANLESLQSLVRQLSEGHAQFDQEHEAAREQLLSLLPAVTDHVPVGHGGLDHFSENAISQKALSRENFAGPRPGRERLLPAIIRTFEFIRRRNRFPQWIGELTMRQRISLGCVAATILLGLFLLGQGFETKQLSAMERMAENIRKAKSFKYTEIVTYTDDLPEPGKPSVVAFTYINYGERDSFRSERFIPSWKGAGPEAININSASKPCIHISNSHKTYSVRPPISKKGYFSDDQASLDNLGNFSGSADRELGTKEINGKKARGFEIGLKKIRPDSDGGLAEIWIDVESNLPIQVRYENPKILESFTTELFTDIQWNIDIDPKLFDTTPPEGYTEATENKPDLKKQLEQINLSLQIYAEACGGQYPRDCPDFFTTQSLCKLLGLAKWPTKTNWPTKEDEVKAARAAKAIDGFSEIAGLHCYNADFAYYGQTVTSNDKDKVLLRWKLGDGRYEVIYGDLRDETVSAERLRELEGK